MELRADYSELETPPNSRRAIAQGKMRMPGNGNTNTNTKGGHMTTYKHLKELNKNELIAIIKDCDHQINYLTRQLERNR